MSSLSRRERLLVGLAVLAVVIVLGYIYVIEPLRERTRERADLVPAREATLERRRLLIAQRDKLSTELTETVQRLQQQSASLLPGPTPPLAASQLQNLLKELALGAGVEVRSERILPPADRSGIQEVPIEITVAGGIRETVNMLQELERTSATKLLTVQELKVRLVSVGQPRDLLTTLTVSGYLLTGAAPPRLEEKPAGPSKG
jgi:Tfp pilus assembly protein PilO